MCFHYFMRENDIRRILAHVCRDLDLAARRSARPAALGATLLVAPGCGSDTSLPGPADGGGADAADSGSTALYSAPVGDSGTGGTDGGTVTPVYSVPFDAGVDSGPTTKYGVPVVDSGPLPEYMAIYMAP
jgi:hypothetical protein